MEETLREIKKRFRMAMNGIVSTSMREKGMDYRINFGLTLSLIRNIAESYTPNAELAQYLWKEQIRESKMLATWLYPANEMNPDKAQQWAEEIPYPEIADICCMNLFIKRLMHRDLQTAKHTADIFRHISETGNDRQKRFAEEILLEYEFCKDTLFPTQDK